MPVWIRFSTICICFSTSISRSAACTCSVTPRRSAASCAPRRISTKKGWLSVLSTSATVGLSVLVDVVSRLHETDRIANSDGRTKTQPRRHEATKKTNRRFFVFSCFRGCIWFLSLSMVFSFKDRVEQDCDNDDAADYDLL